MTETEQIMQHQYLNKAYTRINVDHLSQGPFRWKQSFVMKETISPTHTFLDQLGHLVYLFNVVIYSVDHFVQKWFTMF